MADETKPCGNPVESLPGRDWLGEIRGAFDQYLVVLDDDRLIVDCAYSAFLAGSIQQMEDKPWLWIAGPAGSSKTETIRPLEGYPCALFRDDLTSNAFISGDGAPADLKGTPNEDPSLAQELKDKTLICKDYASIRARSEEDVIRFMSYLRSAYDGSISKHSGKSGVGLREYQVRFGLILVTTPLPERLRRLFQQIGERLFTFRLLRSPISEEMSHAVIRRAIVNSMQAKQQREALKFLVHSHLDEAIPFANAHYNEVQLDDPHIEWLTTLSSLACKVRSSPGEEEGTYGEIGTRLGRQLRQLMAAHALFSGRTHIDHTDRETALRLCYDSIPYSLLCIFNYLLHNALTTNIFLAGETIDRAFGHCNDKLAATLKQYKHENIVETSTPTSNSYRLTRECVEAVVRTGLLGQCSSTSMKALIPAAQEKYKPFFME